MRGLFRCFVPAQAALKHCYLRFPIGQVASERIFEPG
jgi:hypothetical protein